MKGDTGAPGAPGTPCAYATVNKDGSLVAGEDHNVVSVLHVPGQYCVQLSPSVPVKGAPAVVSPNDGLDDTLAGGSSVMTHVEYNGPCGTNGESVVTYTLTPSKTTSPLTFADEAFSIVVP